MVFIGDRLGTAPRILSVPPHLLTKNTLKAAPNAIWRGQSGDGGPRDCVSTNEKHTSTFPPIPFGVNAALVTITLLKVLGILKGFFQEALKQGVGQRPTAPAMLYTKTAADAGSICGG